LRNTLATQMRNYVNAMLRAALIVLALAFSAAPVSAGKWEDGIAAHSRGDYAEAVRLWRTLAEQGNVWAQNGLGWMYKNGEGVPQDYAEAVKWYRMAAEQGFELAQSNLADMYAKHEGGLWDRVEMEKWYRRAAEQGYDEAQLDLGNMYKNGEGVPQDYVLSYMWLNLAAAQGNEVAKATRDSVAESMTREQIAEAQRLAREWKPK
jgi:TPR repeat protein